jgi:hypothetical protein
MLFMVIERFADNDMLPIYQHLRSEGRMLPEGLDLILLQLSVAERWANVAVTQNALRDLHPLTPGAISSLPRVFERWVISAVNVATLGWDGAKRLPWATTAAIGARVASSTAVINPQPAVISNQSTVEWRCKNSCHYT